MVFSMFYHVAFAENTSFKTSGIICWSWPHFSLPGELLMDKRDNNGFYTLAKLARARIHVSNF